MTIRDSNDSDSVVSPKGDTNGDVEVTALLDLLKDEDEQLQQLFARALNLYVSPGADAMSESEKLGRLKQAIEDSLK